MHLKNPKARQKVIEMMLDLDLIDCWREDHMEDRKYTWLKKNVDKQARLDYLFFSNTINSKVDKIYCSVIELIILIYFVVWYEI